MYRITLRDPARQPRVPAPWKAVFSQSKKRWYFYNAEAKISSWVLPSDVPVENITDLQDPNGQEISVKRSGEEIEKMSKQRRLAFRSNRQEDENLMQQFEEVDFDDVSTNPHIRQVIVNSSAGYISRSDLPFERVLREDAPGCPYRRRKNEAKTVIHWGQRKMLLMEVEFLTKYAKPDIPVVYAGAAPGSHLPMLFEMFPNLRFILVDPAKFALSALDAIKGAKNVTVRPETFTDATAAEYARFRPLFISDILSAATQHVTPKEKNAILMRDLGLQRRWHEIMKPTKSLLKFNLPYMSGTTVYLKGDVMLPVWGPITTTETRLVVGEGEQVYDHKRYEEQMFYFNTTTRVARYRHDVRGEGIDYCYDCKAEVEILKLYLKTQNNMPDGPELAEAVASLSKRISESIAGKDVRSLAHSNVEPDILRKKQGTGALPSLPSAEY